MLKDQRIADEHAPRLVEHNDGSAHLAMTVQQSTCCKEAVRACAHARWGVHRNGALAVQRGHGDGRFARRARPPTLRSGRVTEQGVQLICVLICLRVRTTDE